MQGYIACVLSKSLNNLYTCLYVCDVMDLFADKGDLCVRVPDLVTLVQNDVIPFPRQQVIAIDSHTGICSD